MRGKKRKKHSSVQAEVRLEEMDTEGLSQREREREGKSGVGVCLLTKSLKSMAVLMDISLGETVPNSAGVNLFEAKFD